MYGQDRWLKFLEQCDMRETIHEWHGAENAPCSCRKGSKPIDGIFATRAVDCAQTGDTSLDDGVQEKHSDEEGNQSDLCCLWMTVRISIVFGHGMPPLQCHASH